MPWLVTEWQTDPFRQNVLNSRLLPVASPPVVAVHSLRELDHVAKDARQREGTGHGGIGHAAAYRRSSRVTYILRPITSLDSNISLHSPDC